MPKVASKERSMALYESIVQLKSVEECCAFFDDLCTVGELRAMEQRYDVARLLDQGWCTPRFWRRPGPAPPPSAGSTGFSPLAPEACTG